MTWRYVIIIPVIRIQKVFLKVKHDDGLCNLASLRHLFKLGGGEGVATPPPLERGSPNKDGLNVDLLGVSSICSVAWKDVYTLIH